MKKSTVLLFSAVLISLFMTGCTKKTSYYQVYQAKATKGDQCAVVGNYFTHSAGNYEVRYNFFSEYGNPGFWMVNNSDSVMFVYLKETFFVINGVAYEYYLSRQWSETSSKDMGEAGRSGASTTITERDVVMIPPHASRYFSEFKINNTKMSFCDLRENPRKNRPTGRSFTESDSPLVFSTFVTFTLGANSARRYNSDSFFVSEIVNVHRDAMFEKVREKDVCGKEKGKKKKRMLFSTPDRFYLKY